MPALNPFHLLGRLRRRVVRWRDARSGRFVSRRYADEHPDTTVAETEPIETRKKTL